MKSYVHMPICFIIFNKYEQTFYVLKRFCSQPLLYGEKACTHHADCPACSQAHADIDTSAYQSIT